MGISERKERERQQRVNDIIDAAEQVFFEKGVDVATMDHIAEKAELSKGTLYLYFKNKSDLQVAIHARGLKILEQLIEEAVDVDQSGLEQLKSISQAYFRFSTDYENYFGSVIMFDKLISDDVACQSPTMESCNEISERVYARIVGVINEGKRDGSIQTDVDAHQLAAILWATTRGVLQFYYLRRKPYFENIMTERNVNLDALLDDYFELISQGLALSDQPKLESSIR